MRSLSVAITGHRLNQLQESEHPRLMRDVSRVFDVLAACAGDAAGARVRPRLLSALAEGADRIGADAALARGWRLVAPLPFAPDEYEKDFADDVSRSQFRAYLAAADRILLARRQGVRTLGYVAANGLLLRGADVLIALWNGNPPKGPGGTAEFMARAAAANRNVIWVGTEPGGQTALVGRAHGKRFRGRLGSALAKQLPEKAAPDSMRRADAA